MLNLFKKLKDKWNNRKNKNVKKENKAMKDLKIGDVVITKATLTGDKEYDEALAKKNGLGKIENIVTSRIGKTYLVRVGENNTDLKYYQESELEIALEDLTEADKEV